MTQLVRWIRDASIAGWKLFPTPLWSSQERQRISGRSAIGSDLTNNHKPEEHFERLILGWQRSTMKCYQKSFCTTDIKHFEISGKTIHASYNYGQHMHETLLPSTKSNQGIWKTTLLPLNKFHKRSFQKPYFHQTSSIKVFPKTLHPSNKFHPNL